MDGASIAHEIRAGIRVAGEELVRQHVALHAIAGGASGNEVPGRVRAAARYRIDVVERRFHRVEVMSAVDTPATAVAHRGPLEGALGVTGKA